MSKTIHNIVASTILSEAMNHIRKEFMISVRGYLNPNEDDNKLMIKAEHAARQALEITLSERPRKYCCPCCGAKLDCGAYNAGNGGDQFIDQDGNEYQDYSAVCPKCKKTVHMVAKYYGILRDEEYNALKTSGNTSPFINDTTNKIHHA